MAYGWLGTISDGHAMDWSSRGARQWLNYIVALLAVGVATTFTLHIQNLLGDDVLGQQTSPLFYAAVMVAAWYGGLGPGLLATVAATLVCALLLGSGRGGVPWLMVLRMGVFVFVAMLISWLNVARKRVQERLHESYHTLEARVAERTAELTRVNVQMRDEVATRRRAQEQLMAQQERLRSMAVELSLAEEQERRRIAVQLHDQIGQILAVTQMRIDALRDGCTDGRVATELDAVRDLIDQTVARTRSLTCELSPPVLYELGFPAAVAWLVERVQKQSRVAIELEEDEQPKPLGTQVRVILFQAVRELLGNMVKHANATQAKVKMERVGDFLRIEVSDNGVGFDKSALPNRASEDNRFGLFNLRERIRRHGGYLEIASSPGAGSRFTVVMKLERAMPVAEVEKTELVSTGNNLEIDTGDVT